MSPRLMPWIILGMLWTGCQSRISDAPPTIRYGEEVCAQCGMLISEARFAAAFVTTSGKVVKFDDIGCLVRYRAQHLEATKHLWVHDYQHEQWLEAEAAFFVHSLELATSMGAGVVALATQEEAAQLGQATHGEVVRFEALPASINKL